jgi:hypothetical protein
LNRVRNTASWTEPVDIVATLRRRWSSGRYLRAYARGDGWEPVRIPIKGPEPSEFLDRFDEVRRWAAGFAPGALGAGPGLVVEHRTVRSRSLGSNRVPTRAVVPTFEELCSVLGTGEDVRALDELLARTLDRLPELLPWMADHVMTVLDHREEWTGVLATIEWVVSNKTQGTYVRHLDVEGVDTKFVERHRRLLSDLLTIALPEDRVDSSTGAKDFARRFGFLAKPAYTRFRVLDASISPFPSSLTELTLRTDELARVELAADTVYIVENETSYLAFPAMERAVVIFGSGFAASGLRGLSWLADKEVVYWGDLDTHGFDILSRLRAHLPGVVSMLMDRTTLLAHRRQWTTEPNPTARRLEHLVPGEQSVYEDLLEDRYGVAVRLEQERLPFSSLRRALAQRAEGDRASLDARGSC